ncbi:MAG: Eco57I restriction-modification methylase domain-containing protein [Desulfococcaceae bacterium]
MKIRFLQISRILQPGMRICNGTLILNPQVQTDLTIFQKLSNLSGQIFQVNERKIFQMILKQLSPKQALNKAWLKVKPNRTEIENFKVNLISLLKKISIAEQRPEDESEEHLKNDIRDFLRDTYYRETNAINTKDRKDLVIHLGKDTKSKVGVIIEAKRPSNKAEMITTEKLNAKAFQELVLYYLRERITHKNLEIKHLVASNINEWFIFDAVVFDRIFAQNKKFVTEFQDFEDRRWADTKTDFFYRQIAAPFIDSISAEIEFTYFNLQDYQKVLIRKTDKTDNDDKTDDSLLIALFKLLSPEHLLKLPFINDSNSLDKGFYSELLHIIGLSESKEGGKKLIGRNKQGQRNTGTFIEDAMIQLDSLDKLGRLENPNHFGANAQEQLFAVALELSITWINRILFLKLLEAQLITYHKGDKSYSFLSIDKIRNYDDLNSLFFQVLARRHEERNEDVKKTFEKVPYLNSSLFEPTDLEQLTLFVSNLKNDKTIPVFSQTVLKDRQGRKRTGSISAIEYLFAFLDAYDFSSEGSEEIQEDNKTLINASVLGLIFEKINGYRDGSFFTPGFITMYMCRETIRKAVVQKFNEIKKWKCTNIEELYDKIENRKEANEILNSIKICDPAVGSGHFLVSALNEMIAVKNDLKILLDRDGKRLKEYPVEVENDELTVTDEDGGLFEYNPKNRESQRIQETLFHEKQTIIENCLFGVDINSNSVKICRLRLWIELLKNAYYKNATELETLPNIDINIKCGNSLVSRFPIDADLKHALKKSRHTIDEYRIAVDTYRNAQTKEQKKEMERLIADIKSDFRSEISQNDPKVKKLRKLSGELLEMTSQGQFFEMSKKEKADWNRKKEQLTKEIQKLEAEMEEIKTGKIFENAFEWRFEFPEVLNDDGDFAGFDVVIGNPPYMLISEKRIFDNYRLTFGNNNTFIAFIELSLNISNNLNNSIMIVPNTWMSGNKYREFRRYLIENQLIGNIVQLPYDIFEVYVDTVILHISKNKGELTKTYKFNIRDNFDSQLKYLEIDCNDWLGDENLTIFLNHNILRLRKKYNRNAIKLGEISQIQRGTLPPKPIDLIDIKSETTVPWFDGQIYRFIKTSGNLKFVEYSKLKENKELILFKSKKILARQLISRQFRLQMTLIDEFFAFKKNLYAIYNLDENVISYETLLGILNSAFFSYIIVNSNTSGQRDDFPALSLKDFREFLVPKITKEEHNQISDLVKKIIEIKKQNPKADAAALEKQIDQLVYNLYDLSEEEIKIIESA